MSQTLLRRAFGVSWHYRHVRTGFEWGGVQLFLDLKPQALVCPRCRLADEVIRKGRRCRCLQTVPIGLKLIPSGYSRSSAKDRKAQGTFIGMSL